MMRRSPMRARFEYALRSDLEPPIFHSVASLPGAPAIPESQFESGERMLTKDTYGTMERDGDWLGVGPRVGSNAWYMEIEAPITRMGLEFRFREPRNTPGTTGGVVVLALIDRSFTGTSGTANIMLHIRIQRGAYYIDTLFLADDPVFQTVFSQTFDTPLEYDRPYRFDFSIVDTRLFIRQPDGRIATVDHPRLNELTPTHAFWECSQFNASGSADTDDVPQIRRLWGSTHEQNFKSAPPPLYGPPRDYGTKARLLANSTASLPNLPTEIDSSARIPIAKTTSGLIVINARMYVENVASAANLVWNFQIYDETADAPTIISPFLTVATGTYTGWVSWSQVLNLANVYPEFNAGHVLHLRWRHQVSSPGGTVLINSNTNTAHITVTEIR